MHDYNEPLVPRSQPADLCTTQYVSLSAHGNICKYL